MRYLGSHPIVLVCLVLSLGIFASSPLLFPTVKADGRRVRQERCSGEKRAQFVSKKGSDQLNEILSKLPLNFEKNIGQASQDIEFLSYGSGYRLMFKQKEAVLSLDNATGSTVLSMKIKRSNPHSSVIGLDQLEGRTNYLRGRNRTDWKVGASNYRKVKYKQIYKGIDLVYYGNQNQLEYDFIVSPGTDPNLIRIEFEGAEKLTVDERGDLVIKTSAGLIRHHKPEVYQMVAGRRESVAGSYLIRGDEVSFDIGRYNRNSELVIDPFYSFGTYLAGNGNDSAQSIAVDSTGHIYITGETRSTNFPRVPGSYKTVPGEKSDIFVSKMSPDGTSLVYSTYLGGSADDSGFGLAVDSAGNAYVTGETQSSDFPVTPNAFQKAFSTGNCGSGENPLPCSDAFVTKLSASGSALIYSTFIGSRESDRARAIDVDADGNAYITGTTSSQDFPVTAGAYQSTSGGGFDLFVTKLSQSGSALTYSTVFGGGEFDSAYAIAVDPAGSASVAGETQSIDFPAVSGIQGRQSGKGDAFITRVNPQGSAITFSTYLGGSNLDAARAIALNDDDIYVAGGTQSSDFLVTPGALQTSFKGGTPMGGDAFVVRVNPSIGLIYSTYLGGSRADSYRLMGLAVDGCGNAYIAGQTSSEDFPTTTNGRERKFGGGNDDSYLSIIGPAGNQLIYSTFIGGNSSDDATAVAIDSFGNAYVAGGTFSDNFPTTPNVYQPNSQNIDPTRKHNDGFVVRLTSLTSPYNFTINLNQGWNLISMPLQPVSTNIIAVLAGIKGKYTGVWTLRDDRSTYKGYFPSTNTPDELFTMEAGTGYWVYMRVPARLCITGTLPGATAIELLPGWNIVGFNGTAAVPTSRALTSVAGKITGIWGWNSAANKFQANLESRPNVTEVPIMEPGKGYLIYAKERVTWILP
jgi:hypothetical protein